MLRLRKSLFHFSACIIFLGIPLSSCGPAYTPDTISGIVIDEHGPLIGAVVRVQTTENYTTADINGKFTLSGLDAGQAVTVTAWQSGFFIAGEQNVIPGTTDVEIYLEAHAESDNPDY